MLERTILINDYIKNNNFKSYLEIGVGNNSNFDNVFCDKKVSCDTNNNATFKGGSDDFFLQNTDKFDVIFVDGLHLSEQVIKDVKNSLLCLNYNGIILIHDCLPHTEHHQFRDRISKCWLGDVWKAIVYFARNSQYMELHEVETGIVLMKKQVKKYKIAQGKLNWDWYLKNYKNIFK